MVWFKHRGTRHSTKRLHEHPSYPYPHPAGRWHLHPPTSRIRDRKGRKFRNTPAEHRHKHNKRRYRERGGKISIWD